MNRFSKSCIFQLLTATAIYLALTSPLEAASKNVATEQVDQQQTSFNPLYSTVVGDGQEVAQTFSPGVSGNLTRVLVMLKGNSEAVANLKMEVRPVVLGDGRLINVGIVEMPIPDDSVLATVELEVTNFDNEARWYEFKLEETLELQKGTDYAITFSTLETPYRVCLAETLKTDKDDPYKGGSRLVRNLYFPNWAVNSYTDQDIPFMTFIAR